MIDAPELPIILVIIISTAVGMAITCVALFLKELNRPLALMLFAIAFEIALAIVADFYIQRFWIFTILKITGRSVEGIGIGFFFKYLVDLKDAAQTLAEHQLKPNANK